MTRAFAFVAILVALLFVQLIGAPHQPVAASTGHSAGADAPAGTTVEVHQRALEELAAWPAAAGR